MKLWRRWKHWWVRRRLGVASTVPIIKPVDGAYMKPHTAEAFGKRYLAEQAARGFTPTTSVWVEFSTVDGHRARIWVNR